MQAYAFTWLIIYTKTNIPVETAGIFIKKTI